MADKLMRAQVTLHHGSGVAENDIVNTFYFDGDDFPGNGDELYHDVVEDGVHAFYSQIQGFYSDHLTGGYTLKIYDMADPQPRVPERVVEKFLTGFGSINENLPAEVAVCGSYAAAAQSGIPAGRLRGRVFIGPLNASAMSNASGACMVSSGLVSNLVTALNELGRLDIPAASQMSVRHSIYSPTIDQDATIGVAFNDVVRGWVDNAFDTQRRRGEQATSRSTYTVAL